MNVFNPQAFGWLMEKAANDAMGSRQTGRKFSPDEQKMSGGRGGIYFADSGAGPQPKRPVDLKSAGEFAAGRAAPANPGAFPAGGVRRPAGTAAAAFGGDRRAALDERFPGTALRPTLDARPAIKRGKDAASSALGSLASGFSSAASAASKLPGQAASALGAARAELPKQLDLRNSTYQQRVAAGKNFGDTPEYKKAMNDWWSTRNARKAGGAVGASVTDAARTGGARAGLALASPTGSGAEYGAGGGAIRGFENANRAAKLKASLNSPALAAASGRNSEYFASMPRRASDLKDPFAATAGRR